jgi:hypothetical protein
VPVSILLDAHLSPETAYRLTALGFDVVPARDRRLLRWKDWALMDWCAQHERVICTRNRKDFEREHERRRDRGIAHPGVLIVADEWSQEAIYWALRQYLESSPEPALLRNQVYHLAPATEEFVRERSEAAP